MPVDISNVLHVLAHELRTPSGIAQGYLRMLLEERLTDPADQRRALEQTQKALARVSELTRESSRLAAWLEESRNGATQHIDAHAFVARVVEAAAVDPPPQVEIDVPTAIAVPTVDGEALVEAMVTLVRATARELKREPCTITARVQDNNRLDIWIGRAPDLPKLSAGPDATDAAPLALERGGLGLSLVMAAAILERHGAIPWTSAGSRSTVGIRFRLLKERAHQ